MRTLQEKYNAVLEGNFSKTQFKRDAAIEMPQFVSNVNSFEDTVSILKNKGTITEAKKEGPKYSTAKPADQIAPDVLDTGIKFELDKKYGTLDVTPEQYAKCREMAIKNLSKDVLYYVKQDSIQLEEPGEKMEKAKLNEEMSKEEAWRKFQKDNHVTSKTVIVAKKDFEKEWAKRTDEVKVKVSIPGQDEFEAEEGKDYSEEEADKYIANAEKHGATPMGTEFTKTDEAIQNIENDEQTKRRVAGLVNQLLQSVDPRDETVKAYAISVKNDLESRDPSRLSRYKDVATLDDIKDDMEHFISHDVDQLEEEAVNEADIKLSAEDMEKLHKDGKITLPNGSVLHFVGKADEEVDATEKAASDKIGRGEEFTDDDAAAVADKMPKIKKGTEFKLIGEDEPDAEDLYQHDDEYLATLKQRKALKEMFKKIITKVINE